MRGRTLAILDRLPAHWQATDPNKLLGLVTEGLAAPFDALSTELAQVRLAHRLSQAPTLQDLALLAGLHGIAGEYQRLLTAREKAARTLLHIGDTAALHTLVALLGASLPPAPEGEPPTEPLDLFRTTGSDDDAEARLQLEQAVQLALSLPKRLERTRRHLGHICSLHAQGNGTVASLLYATAAALDLVPYQEDHSEDRFWHALRCHHAPWLDDAEGAPLAAAEAAVVLEENPLRWSDWGPRDGTHRDLFTVLRRGFARQGLQVTISGVQDRTWGPMLVNRDEGMGVGYAGGVPAGSELVFTLEGRALLDGLDVTSHAYGWTGGVFTDSPTDTLAFVFADADAESSSPRDARFAISTPDGVLHPWAVFPHGGEPIPPLGIAPGQTRFAFFVAQAHLGSVLTEAPDALVSPRPFAARADESVFAPPGQEGHVYPVAAEIQLGWFEHSAHEVIVWIPEILAACDTEVEDTEDEPTLAALTRIALERHRPAGVHLQVRYQSDAWILGHGQLAGTDPHDPIAALRYATRLSGAIGD